MPLCKLPSWNMFAQMLVVEWIFAGSKPRHALELGLCLSLTPPYCGDHGAVPRPSEYIAETRISLNQERFACKVKAIQLTILSGMLNPRPLRQRKVMQQNQMLDSCYPTASC
jgi:hypothetical protein